MGRMESAPEWRADPFGRHEHRYWDGAQWTEHVSDAGRTSSDPVLASERAVPPPPPAPPQPPVPQQPHAQIRQRPPSGTAGQAAAFWLGWLPLAIVLLVTYIGLPIFIGVTARRLGYRGHDWLMLFIPYYGV